MMPLVRTFVSTFQKALRGEVEAVQRRFGSASEIALHNARHADGAEQYSFDLQEPTDKLTPPMECRLRHDGGEVDATIVAADRRQVTVLCVQSIDLDSRSYSLVIFPAFLYERLQVALDGLLDSEDYAVASALRLFGKLDPVHAPRPVALDLEQLNASQRRAVELCRDSDLALIWGPPGTGKTTTLGYVVAELLNLGQRVLITSTTNAAVDQVLAKLAELPATRPHFEDGRVVRVGQAQGPTHGASLSEVTTRLNARLAQDLQALDERRAHAARGMEDCALLLERLAAVIQPAQLDLFARGAPAQAVDFSPIFSTRRSNALRRTTGEEQMAIVARRQRRLEWLAQGYGERIRSRRLALVGQEAQALRAARVVLTTTTSLYVSPLLRDERFDAVIVEEAGMTILPALFFCACLARRKVVIVGDPRQLPAIVQSNDPFVRKYLGTNIFSLAAPDLDNSEVVVMLDTQYRMHPTIGELVSTLYYGGKLRHHETTARREAIAAAEPFPGDGLVVVDTAGQSTCATHAGQYSRFNTATAKLCVELAVAAVRAGITSVGIITPYAEQSRLIRELLAAFQREAAQVECRTVHRFQGSERDMIILDTVDTAPFAPGVLLAGGASSAARNLVNVSISRARGKLVVVADVGYFQRAAPASAIGEMLEQALLAGRRAAAPATGSV